jgi:hypothetical protein
MNSFRIRVQSYPPLNSQFVLSTLILLCFPIFALAASGDTPTTAELLAQVTDPATATTAAQPTAAQSAPAPENGFSTEQLEQLVAPIALYPDALLTQILMASTYPLEIVEAERWIRNQPDLKGDALEQALLEKNWDPSVESLTALPSVLKQMSENLDWTQDLGDAFLAQQNDLMDAAQRMRGKAYEAGNLETSEQQTVTQQEDKIIIIESASPEVIYVPTYSPTVVYGPGWGYPHWYYPSYYYPYPPGSGLLAFGVGVAVGGAIWGGARWGWGHTDINIDIDRHNEFNRNTNNNFDRNRANANQGNRGQGGKSTWQHDASHRKGVNYGSSDVAKKYGASSGSNRVSNNQARGHSAAAASNRAGIGAQTGNRAAAYPKTSAAAANRSSNSASRSPSTANRGSNSSALSGSRSPSTDRMSSSRGASSRGTASFGGSRGGASRGGGGRRR